MNDVKLMHLNLSSTQKSPNMGDRPPKVSMAELFDVRAGLCLKVQNEPMGSVREELTPDAVNDLHANMSTSFWTRHQSQAHCGAAEFAEYCCLHSVPAFWLMLKLVSHPSTRHAVRNLAEMPDSPIPKVLH